MNIDKKTYFWRLIIFVFQIIKNLGGGPDWMDKIDDKIIVFRENIRNDKVLDNLLKQRF